MKRFKLVATVELEFKGIQSYDKALYSTFSSKAEIITNENDIDDVFESIYSTVKSKLDKFPGQGLSWVINSVIEHNINISKYDHLAGSNHIKLPKELHHSRKELVVIQNGDDEK